MLREAAMFTTASHDSRRAVDLDVADEGAVDLDLVEREPLQIAQRRVAGAEIVERDPHPDGAQLMQDRDAVSSSWISRLR